jgi:glycosyltransferase involved in cell wall biosynthesis
MRLIHVTPHLPPDQAANAILPAQAGVWSMERGHDVVYVSHPPAQGGVPAAPDAGPVTWVPRRMRQGMLGALRLDAWLFTRHIHRVLDQVAAGADLLHLHSNGLLIEAAATWARQHSVPYVLTMYGTEIWHYEKRWPIDFFRRAYMHAAAVTFYSRRLMERARELELDRPGLSVIYPAVADSFTVRDAATRAALRHDLGISERFLIVNVKRLHELAGQTYLLDAFAALNRRDVRLVICGTGGLRESLQSQAQKLGIGDRVTFAGLVANDDVARYTAAADVFALPSLLEALPTVAVEALASGTPVVSADHPGGLELQELFEQDVNVVPRRDVPTLARALGDALRAERRTTAHTADVLQRRFSQSAVAAEYDHLYRSIVSPSRA